MLIARHTESTDQLWEEVVESFFDLPQPVCTYAVSAATCECVLSGHTCSTSAQVDPLYRSSNWKGFLFFITISVFPFLVRCLIWIQSIYAWLFFLTVYSFQNQRGTFIWTHWSDDDNLHIFALPTSHCFQCNFSCLNAVKTFLNPSSCMKYKSSFLLLCSSDTW